jgi:hypothetical protein
MIIWQEEKETKIKAIELASKKDYTIVSDLIKNANAIYGFINGKTTDNQEENKFLLSVLNNLGVSLANHKHKWTSKERTDYEKAMKILK